MELRSKEGQRIPFESMEKWPSLVLPPVPFRGADGGKAVLDQTLRELYDNPNIRSADHYVLQSNLHFAPEALTSKLRAVMLAAGAVEHPPLPGLVLLKQQVPSLLIEYENAGLVHLRYVPRHFHMGDVAFVHIPEGPRIARRTPTRDPAEQARQIRSVTDREQSIVDTRPEYLKVEVSLTDKIKRRFEREEFAKEVAAMPRTTIENFTNHGVATFGDSSPVTVNLSPRELAARVAPMVEEVPDGSLPAERRELLRDALVQYSVGVAAQLSADALAALAHAAPYLGPLARVLLSAFGHPQVPA